MLYVDDNFHIVDRNGLINYCNTLRRCSKQLNNLVNDLNNNLNSLNNYWENNDGIDKMSYMSEVKECINYLNDLANAGYNFAGSMETFHYRTNNTQGNVVG